MFKLILISDTHFSADHGCTDTGWKDLASCIQGAQPDLVIHTGDIVFDRPDCREDHAYARKQLDALGPKWLAIPGNHDVGDGPPATMTITQALIDAFVETYDASHWSLDIEKWRLIGANSMLFGSGLPQEEAEWTFLEQALAGAGSQEIAVFVHKPIFLTASDEPQAGTATQPQEVRTRLWHLLRRHAVRLVLSGHRHEYRVVNRDGIQCVFIPTASRLALNESTPPFDPKGTTAGLVECIIDERTILHRFVGIGGPESPHERSATIDMRSDVLAPSSERIITAMAAAARAPLAFLRSEDVQQQKLIGRLTEMFGFEDGLFLPTGTLANQIAVRLWCQPGEALLADPESHVASSEAASVAGLGGAVIRTITGELGHLHPDAIPAAIKALPGSAPERALRLVWLENTHNRAGGTVMPAGWQEQIAAICQAHGLPIHLDGARLFNAIVASQARPEQTAVGVSSLTLCLNKGLGAPMGAMLLGSHDFIAQAVRVQKMFGGLWRPVSVLAAAAATALDEWTERIERAHQRAQQLAKFLGSGLPDGVAVCPPQTNIVMLQLRSDAEAADVMTSLKLKGLLVSNYRRGRLRLVTHWGISVDDVEGAAAIIQSVLSQ